MSFSHEHRLQLAATPERVFRALTDPTELAAWFAERVDVSAVAGGPFRFWGRFTLGAQAEAEADQRLVRIEPDRELAFSWRLYGVPTEVAWALEADGDAGSKITVRHRVDGDLAMPRPKELVDDYWRLVTGNLMSHVAGGEGIFRPDFTDPAPEVRLSLYIAAPPAKVFRTLLDPESVQRWVRAGVPEIDPRPGGRYTFNMKYQVEGRDVIGGPTHILELVPDQKLVLDWPDWRGDDTVTGQTITFQLAPEGAGTRLTFTHAGFVRAADISDYPFGWGWFMDNLKQEAERE